MELLSWLFFCLSPFALFCTESGGGLILCPVFIILGFIFKYVGSNISDTPTAVVKVEPTEFWEWHYKDRMRSTLAQKDTINDGLMALKDKEARDWATTICGYHNAWVPPEAAQEKIARSNGVITVQMVKENASKKDRVQIGKYFLLKELAKMYSGKQFGTGIGGKYCCPCTIIKNDLHKVKLSNRREINENLIEYDYKMSLRAIWDNLPKEEKSETVSWIKKYEDQLIKQINIYIEDERHFDSVDVDF